MVLPSSSGRSDMATAVAPDSEGQLRVAWSSDTRDYDATIHRRAEVYSGVLAGSIGRCSGSDARRANTTCTTQLSVASKRGAGSEAHPRLYDCVGRKQLPHLPRRHPPAH